MINVESTNSDCFTPFIETCISLHRISLNSLMETVQIFSIKKILFSFMSYTTLMVQRFVVTHTVRQTETPISPDSWVTNTPSVKMLCPQKESLLLTRTFVKPYFAEFDITWTVHRDKFG